MNYCQTCLSAKDISTCSESLTIGTATADTAYKVYVKNLSTQRIDVFETTSTNAGLIIISLAGYVFNEGNPYEIWVTADGASPNSHEQLTVGTFITTCITLSAIAYKNASDGCNVVIEDEVIIPEEDNEDFVASTCVCVTEAQVTQWNSGASLPYKSYVALLSQTGTNDPTAVVLQNELSGAIVWTYDSGGNYKGTLAGAFLANKVWCFIYSNGNVSVSANFFLARMDDDTVLATAVQLVTPNPNDPTTNLVGIAADGIMDKAEVEIRVYP